MRCIRTKNLNNKNKLQSTYIQGWYKWTLYWNTLIKCSWCVGRAQEFNNISHLIYRKKSKIYWIKYKQWLIHMYTWKKNQTKKSIKYLYPVFSTISIALVTHPLLPCSKCFTIKSLHSLLLLFYEMIQTCSFHYR